MVKEGVDYRFVTNQFRPNLAAKLMMTAEQRRRFAAWNRMRNYKERLGKPIHYWGDSRVNTEIDALRNHVRAQASLINMFVKREVRRREALTSTAMILEAGSPMATGEGLS